MGSQLKEAWFVGWWCLPQLVRTWSRLAPWAGGAEGEGGIRTRAIAVRWKLDPDAPSAL